MRFCSHSAARLKLGAVDKSPALGMGPATAEATTATQRLIAVTGRSIHEDARAKAGQTPAAIGPGVRGLVENQHAGFRKTHVRRIYMRCRATARMCLEIGMLLTTETGSW